MHIQVTHFDGCSFYLGLCTGIFSFALVPFILTIQEYVKFKRSLGA